MACYNVNGNDNTQQLTEQVGIVLPDRSTRGKKLSQLVGEEQEKDAKFWDADLWQDEAEDEEFSSREDEVDADFDAPEEAFEAAEADEPDRPKKRSHMAYVDPSIIKAKQERAKKKRKIATGEAVPVQSNEDSSEQMQEISTETTTSRSKKSNGKASSQPRTLRQSTIDYTTKRAVEREKETKVLQHRRMARPQKIKERQLTQEELLEESKRTEAINSESLQQMLQSFEEKKKMITRKPKYTGPATTFRSFVEVDEEGKRFEKSVVHFSEGIELPDILLQKAPLLPTVPLCVLSCQPQQPAKYRDPLTGKPFHSPQCFKEIRARYFKDEEQQYAQRIAQLEQLIAQKRKKQEQLSQEQVTGPER